MRAAIAFFTLALAACGGASTVVEEPERPSVDAEEAEQQARDVIGEVHASIKRGSPEGMLPVVAEDVFVVGPGAGDVFVDRSAAIVALTDLLGNQREQKHKLRSRRLTVVAAPGGRSAWATEELELNGTTYAVTAVLADRDDLWVVEAVHVARPLAGKKIEKAAEAGTLPRPASPPAGTDPDAEDVIDLLAEVATSVEPRAELMAQLASGKDVVLVGPAPKDVTRGANKIKKRWNKSLKKKPRLAIVGQPRAGATPDGALVWILASADLSEKGGPATPHRLFYVYQRDDDAEAGWSLVAAHEAVIAP